MAAQADKVTVNRGFAASVLAATGLYFCCIAFLTTLSFGLVNAVDSYAALQQTVGTMWASNRACVTYKNPTVVGCSSSVHAGYATKPRL